MEKVIYKADKCLLWERTRGIAQDRGLTMTPFCPLEETCTGQVCEVVESPEQKQERLDFMKLTDLREELQSLS